MKDGNFYQIAGWMGNRFGLRGNELICFAVIYGFSQDEETWFNGNLDYLSGCMFCSRPTTLLCLKNLLKLDLIRKYEAMVNGKKRCYYKATVSFEDGHVEYIPKEKDTSKEPLPMTSKEPLPNNNSIYNNKGDNKEKRLSNDNQKKVFVKPTIQQIEEYIKNKGYHFDAEQFWNHYESVGWMIGKNHMKDWHCACATWEGRRKQDIKEKKEKEANTPLTEDVAMKWDAFRKWAAIKVPTISGMVTCQNFKDMMSLTNIKSDVVADVLKEMESSFYDGMDIMTEFDFYCQMDKFSNRIKA